MQSDINYFRIDSNNIFNEIDQEYGIELKVQLFTTIASSQEVIVGKSMNKFFQTILKQNEGDLYSINQSLSKQIQKQDETFASINSIIEPMNNILNYNFSDLEITVEEQIIEDISRILCYGFNFLEQHKKLYNIKTQADFNASLFEIIFNDIDLVKEYSCSLFSNSNNNNNSNDDIQISDEIASAYQQRKGSNSSLHKSFGLISTYQQRQHNTQFSSLREQSHNNSYKNSNGYNHYVYRYDLEHCNALPNELVILVNKFQYIRRINLSIEEINEDKLLCYIMFLLNVNWLFPNLIEVEFDLQCKEISLNLDEIFKQRLKEKMKELNKNLKTTMYDSFNQMPHEKRKGNWDVNMNTTNINIINTQQDFRPPGSFSINTMNVNHNNHNIIIEPTANKRFSFSIRSPMSNLFGNNEQNKPITLKQTDDDVENILMLDRNGVNGLSLINQNSIKFDMIIIFSYFLSKWKNMKVLMLRFPDSFTREIETTLNNREVKFIDFHFMNFFVDISQLIDISIEFNALDSINFEKILGLIKNNNTLRILRLSLFSDDQNYSPSALYKLCFGMKYSMKNLLISDNKTFSKGDYVYDDIDRLILSKLLRRFQINLEILLCLLQRKKDLLEFTCVLDLPSLIIGDDKYNMSLIKFIINILILIAFESHKFKVIKLISPLLVFDSRKYPIILQILDELGDEQCQSNLSSINVMTIQLKLFSVINISNLITTSLTTLFLGDMDIPTFTEFVKYYSSETFIKKSQLTTIKVSLANFISNYDNTLQTALNAYYKSIPVHLNENFLFSNLTLSNDDLMHILTIINLNEIEKYYIEINMRNCSDHYLFTNKIQNTFICNKRTHMKFDLLLKYLIKKQISNNINNRKFIWNYICSFVLFKKDIIIQPKGENDNNV